MMSVSVTQTWSSPAAAASSANAASVERHGAIVETNWRVQFVWVK
jgi:hypothetical protein